MKKGFLRFFAACAVLCAGFVVVAYASYFIKLLIWPEGLKPFLVCVGVLLAALLPLLLYRRLKEHLPRRLFAVLRGLYIFAAAFYTVTFCVLCAYVARVNSAPVREDLPEKTVFVVYGAGLRGEEPGHLLVKRLNTASQLMERFPESLCIVTGGQGRDEVISEAEAMERYLTGRGIASDRIIAEDKAENTAENIKLSLELICERGLEEYTVVSISNAFHIPRIRLLCGRLGMSDEAVAAPDPVPWAVFPTMVREYMSYVKLLIFGSE